MNKPFQFYRPAEAGRTGVVADPIPFYHDGEYHVFYLRPGGGADWAHISTRDFVVAKEWPIALRSGGPEAQDFSCFTGCAFEHRGRFHIFYTGHNQNFRKDRPGEPFQVILHATSDDLKTWRKDPSFFFKPDPAAGYRAVGGWRDPFVYKHPERGEFGMLITASSKEHGSVVAYARSDDLLHWEAKKPFFLGEADTRITECPDLFRIGDWWYLIYFDRGPDNEPQNLHWKTRYRMSRQPDGPWTKPAVDDFDGRSYGAAKTAGTGSERYLFGWLARRNPEEDGASWGWGGSLLVYEIHQRPDGTLATRLPEAALNANTRAVVPELQTIKGRWSSSDDALEAAPGEGRSTIRMGVLPPRCVIEGSLLLPVGGKAGWVFGGDEKLRSGFRLEFDPDGSEVRFFRFPRESDQGHQVVCRPLSMPVGEPVRIRMMIDGSAVAMDFNREVTLSGRMYDRAADVVGLFSDGPASLLGLKMRAPQDATR